MKSDAQIHKERNWIATIATIIMLLVAGLFVFKVIYYVDAIKSGEIDTTDYSSLGSYSSSATLFSGTELPEGVIDVVTSDDPYLGTPGAPVVIVEFADFECPYCQEASYELRELVSAYPKDVHYIFRDFPITDIHPNALLASQAAECAHDQGRFWDYHDKLFQNQSDIDEEELYLLAEQLNLDIIDFRSCLENDRTQQEVLEDYEDGVEAGVRGTPTFYVNGNRIPGSIPGEVLELIVQSVISE